MRWICLLPLAASTMILSGCDSMGIGDTFDYSTKIDEFSGAKISEAASTFAGDTDKEARLTVTLRCKYDSKAEPDPFASTTLEFLLNDSKDQPREFDELTIKFDDSPPPEARFLVENDISKYSNVSEQYYAKMAALMIPGGERLGVLFGLSLGMVNPTTAHRLANLALNAKKMMVRYETKGGMVNTAAVPINGGNFRKVLADCGWDKLSASGTPPKTDVAPANSPPAQPPTAADDRPPQQIVNDPNVKARLAQISAAVAWTKDDDAQGMRDCWSASEDMPDHTVVIDRYCLGKNDNTVYVYDAAQDSWGPITPSQTGATSNTGGGNLYNIYASVPTGDPTAASHTNAILGKLRQCGIQASSDNSYNYHGLTPNLLVVLSGPYPSVISASSELNRAKVCSVAGYTKAAGFVGGE